MINNITWNLKYDVVVVGFGGAGATAARFAADNGARVLLLDSAPYGHEGGNTRYAAQLIGTGNDYNRLLKYYHNLTQPLSLPKEMAEVYVKGMSKMPEYVEKYLGVKPYSMKHNKDQLAKYSLPTAEYPELEGSDSYDYTTVHAGMWDAALWKLLRQKVIERKSQIDVWLSSPAKHLIRDTENNTICGVEVERENKKLNILASKGVILTCGGFECNKEMIQNYLGASKLAPLGTLYNHGDGVRMSAEIGAKLWHMKNYESYGFMHGLEFYTPEGQRARLITGWTQLYQGSIFVCSDDGTRYFREDEPNRHGHISDHGDWRVPFTHEKLYLIFDKAQLDDFKNNYIPYDNFDKKLIKADSIEKLGKEIEVSSTNLAKTVEEFNFFVKEKRDYAFNRDPKTMRAFGTGPYYALRLSDTVLNTQGGPERNEKSQILDYQNNPIPHLFGAGELGGICANKYQGGGNLAECLIFGKIAGENAAKNNSISVQDIESDLYGINDLIANEHDSFSLGKDQFIGASNKGIGGKLVVRVTYKDRTIKKIEIVENHESEDIAQKALKEMPERIVNSNSTDVDAVSGASTTSNAIKSAVNSAIDKAKDRQ